MRVLNENEKVEWVHQASQLAVQCRLLSDEEVLKLFDQKMSEMELKELEILVLERDFRSRKGGTYLLGRGGHLRKSAEAMRLSFPDYDI